MHSYLPLITVFTPTYNRRHTLHRVHESIQNQTLLKDNDAYIFEWIIVDDGSTDGTKELVQEWQNANDFKILYTSQENSGKPAATRCGIELAQGELFLIADSDDAFLPETFETFYTTWMDFSEADKKWCGGIGTLCQDQFGNRIGNDYPAENIFIPVMDTVFGWRDKGLGETWSALKTKNLKKYFVIPEEGKHLKFIPESFFWSRITIEAKHVSYFINKVLRVYYKENSGISHNIQTTYPEGFEFESRYFIEHYGHLFFKYPKIYLTHLMKYIMFSSYNQKALMHSFNALNENLTKVLYIIFLLPSLLYKYRYFKQ